MKTQYKNEICKISSLKIYDDEIYINVINDINLHDTFTFKNINNTEFINTAHELQDYMFNKTKLEFMVFNIFDKNINHSITQVATIKINKD